MSQQQAAAAPIARLAAASSHRPETTGGAEREPVERVCTEAGGRPGELDLGVLWGMDFIPSFEGQRCSWLTLREGRQRGADGGHLPAKACFDFGERAIGQRIGIESAWGAADGERLCFYMD